MPHHRSRPDHQRLRAAREYRPPEEVFATDALGSFSPGEDDANAQWSKWTPSGQLQLTITNPEIFPMLRTGRLFFVDFIAADAAGGR